MIDNGLILLDIVTCFYNLTIYSQSNLTCRMASESSTCAFSNSSEKLDSDSSKSGKDSTIIQSKVTVIREEKSESFNKIYYSTFAACLFCNEDFGSNS